MRPRLNPARAIGSAGLLCLVATGWSLTFTAGATVAGDAASLQPGPAVSTSCVAEAEPNDQPDTAVNVTGAACLDGSLPDGDGQDTWVWTIGDADAQHSWTVSFRGMPGAKSSVQLQAISSAPGVTPIAWSGQPLLVVETGPGPTAATASDVLLPAGRYVLGVGRTASLDGSPLASLDYTITVSPGDPLPPDADTEPNDDPAHAVGERDAFAMSGDVGGSPDVIAWKLGSDAATHGWDVVLQGGLGTGESLDLESSDGLRLTGTGIDLSGEAHLYDLHLAAGTYLLRVLGGAGTGPQPYVVRSFIIDTPGSDPEPNDDAIDATPISAGVLQRGRLARAADVDQYLLQVDDRLSARLLDIRFIARSGPARRVCISGVDATAAMGQLKCFQSAAAAAGSSPGASPGGSALEGLLLQPGSYLITVTGEASPSDTYALRVDATSSPAPDFETEPDDTPATAVRMAPTTVMRGLALSGDPDVFRVVTTGDPQAWTVQVTGSQLDGLAWLDGDGNPMALGEVSTDRSTAVLADAFLPAGEHLFQVTSDGGEYSLTLTPRGPPDPDAEREPNNDSTRAQPLLLDQQVTGRLPGSSDVDVYRFSLTAVEHVRLRLTAPVDGAIVASLLSSGMTVAGQTGSGHRRGLGL